MTDLMDRSGAFTIPHSHPALPGHFPGRPIVPGVVLLEETLACLAPGLRLLSAKFVAAVAPGQTVDVASRTASDGRVLFACTVAERTVLQGTAGPPA